MSRSTSYAGLRTESSELTHNRSQKTFNGPAPAGHTVDQEHPTLHTAITNLVTAAENAREQGADRMTRERHRQPFGEGKADCVRAECPHALVLQSQLPGTGWISQRIANIQLRTWCSHVIEACQSSGSKSPVYWMCDCSTSCRGGVRCPGGSS